MVRAEFHLDMLAVWPPPRYWSTWSRLQLERDRSSWYSVNFFLRISPVGAP